MKISRMKELFDFTKNCVSEEVALDAAKSDVQHEIYINNLTRERLLKLEDDYETYDEYNK